MPTQRSFIALAFCLVGCSNPSGDGDTSCTSILSEAVYGGAPSVAGVDTRTAGSVAALHGTVRVDAIDAPFMCSGVLIAKTLVLSAAHCAPQGAMSVAFGPRADAVDGGCGSSPAEVRVLRSVVHPTRDAMLVELASAPEGVSPATLASADPLPDARGIIGGYGRTEAGLSEGRRFAETRIQSVSDGVITVDSGADAGACNGDSGGPLFTLDDSARYVVAGILSEGSATCRGEDIFVDATALATWIDSIQGS